MLLCITEKNDNIHCLYTIIHVCKYVLIAFFDSPNWVIPTQNRRKCSDFAIWLYRFPAFIQK